MRMSFILSIAKVLREKKTVHLFKIALTEAFKHLKERLLRENELPIYIKYHQWLQKMK